MAGSSQKTVVVVNDNAFVQGGAAKVAIGEAVGLAARGHNVVFFAASGPPDPALVGHPNLEAVCLRENYDVAKQPTLVHATRGIWDREAQRAFANLLRKHDPRSTVVHYHMVREQLTASVYSPAFDLGFPVVVTPHEYNIGCPYGGFFDYAQKRCCELRGLSGACLRSHCNEGAYARKLWFYAKGKVQQKVAHVPDRVKHWIFIGTFIRERLRPYLPAGAVEHLVRNPIEVSDEGCRVATEDSPFVFVGRLTVEKDPVTFARAAKALGVPAVFIGDGYLADEVRKANPDAQMVGWVDRAGVKEWMKRGRALVFPSIWYEGQPLTVQEAAALGLPTIASDKCAARDDVEDGVNGLIFEGGNVDDLAAKMIVLQDTASANKMGEEAHRRFWADPPTVQKHLDGLESVFAEVLA